MNGFICIYKPKGISSAHLLNKVKKILDCKCGHMGTLDPLASGVLPIGIGQATRLFDYLLDKEKTYVAVFTFGFSTDSLDMEGKRVNEGGRIPDENEVRAVLHELVGRINQIPPVFSAKCVNGKKSYKLARKGIMPNLLPKEIYIRSIELTSHSGADFTFRITCGGGTYIRAICRDMAQKLDTYATMTALERVRSGIFNIEESVTVEELAKADDKSEFIIPSENAVSFEKLRLSHISATRLLNGLYDEFDVADGLYRVYDEGDFIGVGIIESKKLKMKAYVRG